MTIDAFLRLLDGVKPTQQGWKARCPAHNDKSPSLGIREAEGGRILVHCFAGCVFDDICAALRIARQDLSPQSENDPARIRLAQYQRRYREHVGRRIEALAGCRSNILRESERAIYAGSPIDLASLSDERLDRFLDAIRDAHNSLRAEMGEQDYAEWSSRLGTDHRTIAVG